jgi:predicted RecB family nuclease
MRIVEDTLVLSATDLTGFLACEHLTALEREAAEGGLVRPVRIDAELDLLRHRGEEHEKAYLAHLKDQGSWVIEIAEGARDLAGLRDFEERTVDAMRRGYDYIYQGGFFDGRWSGRADFLRRVDKPSRLGDWSYEVEDTKLARSLKVAALIQTADYSRHVARIQKCEPDHVHVVLGNSTVESRLLTDVAAYYESARRRFEETIVGLPRSTYPDRVEHCKVCRWADVCDAKRRRDDHLSLVAGAHRGQIVKLQAAGVDTMARLTERIEPVPHLSDVSFARLRTQASLQVQGRLSGVVTHRLIEQEGSNHGLALLPAPCAGDLFFDMEGDGLVGDNGLEYLFGALEVVDGEAIYTPFWGHDAAQERQAFERFMDFVMERLHRNPSLHVYHYASYEPSALKRLAGRYATREDHLDRLLRGKVLVDLYAVVRQALQASTESYSLKALEPLYMPQRTDRIRDAGSSVVEYERWRDVRDPQLLQDIADYNRTDCRSTLLLRDWLESRRAEYAARFGVEVQRPEARETEPTEENAAITAETESLAGRLTADVPDDVEKQTAEQGARRLLAGLLDWHRREARPEWWEYFARLEMADDQLREDPYALAGLVPEGLARPDGSASVQRYAFDASQESRIDLGHKWIDPATGKPAGLVVWVARATGHLDLRRGAKEQERGHPRALIPPGPRRSDELRKAMRRVGEWVAVHGIATPGPYSAARELLLGRAPRVAGAPQGEPLLRDGETAVDAASRIALALDAGCLSIQGPPGAGKTYTAAHVALRLTEQTPRRRVGVTALSHRAISHLLSEISAEAAKRGRSISMIQKADAEQGCEARFVRCVSEPAQVVAALKDEDVDIVAGTAWLFSREDMEGTLDTLIVDEASQMSLANVVAMSGSTRNMILCGDPQQLSQPTRGTHPEGAGHSALEHVLRGAHTIAPDQGLFLDVTRRMHPDLCRVISDVFYDGRLRADSSCANQAVDTPFPALRGAGLRFLPVAHAGNGVKSQEEARAVALLAQALMEGTWRDAVGTSAPLTASDVVVLAPYNAQVSTLASVLPRHIRAGTVDKFQGQQAAVAIYSMATSSGEDQRRGMDFLYSLNRLDVALSRARAIAILVCSPALAAVQCRTVDQLVLANALCRLMDRAISLELPSVQDEMRFPGDLEVLAGANEKHGG